MTAATKIAAAGCALALTAALVAACSPEVPALTADAGAPPAAEVPVQPAEAPSEEADTDGPGQEPAEPVHEHVWVSDYELETTEAVTETVHHEAVTEKATEDHTLCNVCREIVDGKVEEHAAKTGHAGATPDVPVEVEVVVKEAWDEERVVSPEETRLVSRTETCTQCGERRDAPEKAVDPQAVADAAGQVQ